MKKALLIITLLLAGSIQAQAVSKAMVATSSGDNLLDPTIPNYVGLGLSRGPGNSASTIESFVPFSANIRQLMCHVDTPPTPGSKWKATFADVGVDTPLTCTMDGNNPFEIDCIDATHTYFMVGGRNGTIRMQPTGNPPATKFNCSVSLELP